MLTQPPRAQRLLPRLDYIREYWALHVEMDVLKVRFNFLRATGQTAVHLGTDESPTRSDQWNVLQEITQVTDSVRAITQRLQNILREQKRLLPPRGDMVPPATGEGETREPAPAPERTPEPEAQPARHSRSHGAKRAS